MDARPEWMNYGLAIMAFVSLLISGYHQFKGDYIKSIHQLVWAVLLTGLIK